MKHCAICGKDRPLNEFGVCRAMKDGRQTRCNACRAAYRAAHRAELAHKEHVRRRSKVEEVRSKRRAYAAAHRAENAARVARWKRNNSERWRQLRRKHKLLRSGMDVETAAYAAALVNDPCSYCGCPAETVDHIIPLSHGGANHWSNLTAACFRCNQSKRTRPALIWWLGGSWQRWQHAWDYGGAKWRPAGARAA